MEGEGTAEPDEPEGRFWRTVAINLERVSVCETTKDECEKARAHMASEGKLESRPCQRAATASCLEDTFDDETELVCFASQESCNRSRQILLEDDDADEEDLSNCHTRK